MECIKALVVALVLGGCARASPIHDAQDRAVIGDWVSAITDTCQRCASAKWDREHAPVSLPERAVVYSFTGEFATRVQWWLINLDTGEITEREAISSADAVWKTETKHFGIVESEAMAALRASAARLWRSQSQPPHIIPGAMEDDYVISGQRLAAFNRFTPSDGYIVTAIDAALKAAHETKQ